MSARVKVTLGFTSFILIVFIAFGISDPWAANVRTPFRILFPIVGLILIFFIYVFVYMKRLTRTKQILFAECDPEKFLGAYSALSPAKNLTYLRVMLVYEGLYAAGRYEEALAELQKLTQFKDTRLGTGQKAAWLVNLAEVSIALGQSDVAERALADCLDMLENREMVWKHQQLLFTAYRNETCKLNMALGHTDGAEAVLAQRFEQAKHEYDRVSAKYHLGQLYRLTGEDEKAREALEYVVAHGNKMHFALLAREQLGLEPQPSVVRLWKQEAPVAPTV